MLRRVKDVVNKTNKTLTEGFPKKVGFKDMAPMDAGYSTTTNRLGPFSLAIDDMAGTEILTSEEVYRDLLEIEEMTKKEPNLEEALNPSSRYLGRSRKKPGKR